MKKGSVILNLKEILEKSNLKIPKERILFNESMKKYTSFKIGGPAECLVKIANTDELEFVVFCIENIAIRLGKKAEEIYQALTEKSDILSSYIIPEYEMLHTQRKDYIVDDIISLMEERGIQL